MPTYAESCPLALTDKVITFTIDGDRKPSPTKGCICGGTKQEQILDEVRCVASVANLGKALGESILAGGKPVQYRAYEFKGRHSSKIVGVN